MITEKMTVAQLREECAKKGIATKSKDSKTVLSGKLEEFKRNLHSLTPDPHAEQETETIESPEMTEALNDAAKNAEIERIKSETATVSWFKSNLSNVCDILTMKKPEGLDLSNEDFSAYVRGYRNYERVHGLLFKAELRGFSEELALPETLIAKGKESAPMLQFRRGMADLSKIKNEDFRAKYRAFFSFLREFEERAYRSLTARDLVEWRKGKSRILNAKLFKRLAKRDCKISNKALPDFIRDVKNASSESMLYSLVGTVAAY